jgi:hypothetical protein
MKCYGDGKVDTSPIVATSYYHLNYETPFCMIFTAPLFQIFETWAISFFFLDHAL